MKLCYVRYFFWWLFIYSYVTELCRSWNVTTWLLIKAAGGGRLKSCIFNRECTAFPASCVWLQCSTTGFIAWKRHLIALQAQFLTLVSHWKTVSLYKFETSYYHISTIILPYYYILSIRVVFSECRKTKTKVISLANHKEHAQYSEPVKTRSNHRQLTQSVGKRVRVSNDWFWFYFWLDGKLARIFKPIV